MSLEPMTEAGRHMLAEWVPSPALLVQWSGLILAIERQAVEAALDVERIAEALLAGGLVTTLEVGRNWAPGLRAALLSETKT